MARRASRTVVLVWVSILLTLVVNNIASYWYHPALALWIPIFAVEHLADMTYIYTLVYPQVVFFLPGAGGLIEPRLWVYLLLTAEVAVPGCILGTLERLARRKPRAKATPSRKVPLMTLMILAGLLLLLAGLIAMRLRQGFLTPDSAFAAGRFFLRFAVLPIVLFFGLDRLTGRRALPEQ